MTDSHPMYWSSNDQAGWYQSQLPADPSITPQPPHQQHEAYQASSYHQMHAGGPPPAQSQPITSDHTSPGPQTMMNGPTTNGSHHMQSNMPPQLTHSNQPPVNNYNRQHHMPNVNNVMHDSPNQQQQQQSMSAPPPPPQTQSQPQMQSLDTSSGYSYAQQPAQTQMYSQQQSTSPNANYPPPPQATHNGGPSHGPSPVSSMHQQAPVQQQPQQQQQQQPQSMYPLQQYSPAPYWNSGPPPPPPQHQQSAYGPPSLHGPPPQQSSPMMHHQSAVSTPPSMDGPPSYPMSNGVMPSLPQQQQAPPPPQPPPTNPGMPYDSRGSGYNSPYPHQAPCYYGSHDQPHTYESQSHHHMPPHQQPPVPNHQPQNNWSNGYYQPNSGPYSNGPSQYSPMPPSYNGAPPPPNRMQPSQPTMIGSGGPPSNHHQHQMQQHQHIAPPHHHQNGPMPQSHQYGGGMQQGQHLHPNHVPHSQQRWPPANQMPPNHQMTIPDRTTKGGQEKKPVKPRSRKNPNGAAGRRKSGEPIMNKEQKKSGYAHFFSLQRKELEANSVNADNKFGDYSRIIAERWAQLSPEQQKSYATVVNNKRKEMLKKKASQQAQDLVQGITQE